MQSIADDTKTNLHSAILQFQTVKKIEPKVTFCPGKCQEKIANILKEESKCAFFDIDSKLFENQTVKAHILVDKYALMMQLPPNFLQI